MFQLKIYALLIGLFGLQNIKAQTDTLPAEEIPKYIISWNPMALFGGNSSIHLSLEKPISNVLGLELDVQYFIHYQKKENDPPINHLNIKTNYGFSGLFTYKLMTDPDHALQFAVGPTFGYRQIQYASERILCTEVAPDSGSDVCQCLNYTENNYTLTSQSIIGAVYIGFQHSYWRKDEGFFFKLHGVLGGAFINPNIDGRLPNISCPDLQEAVDIRENEMISRTQALSTNHTFQFEKTLQSYLTFNVKLGYAF